MPILTKKLLPMAFVISVITASATVSAEEQSGQISFTGLIYSSTCTIDINGTGSDGNVNMGRYATSEFGGTGSEVGGKSGNGKLDISLINCPPQGKVKLKLEGKTDSSSDQILALDNPDNSNTAKNVGIHIYSEQDPSTPYHINLSTEYDIKDTGDLKSKTLSFIAKYVSTSDDVEAGRADATLNYTLTYQ
ncbi:fimbrial protein [Proteus faecis]|uniref:Fimbrial protein n=1 Tax=Proteus faecis TaxID=2050967 RepID=A0AAW7CM31_9GAMM|nr:fimbrial protein [Proteus faecis]MDL5167234.1 fimbrial protein [Proteus faecis]MDL5275112.1 fimbrial protein [Proteus faecis]MDL5278681.1 fimbrial protein [Proteus faecis]MDL5307683.1 fimbrial protein [Proteus faecis]MDL5311348.1 fimbrial protein [Proteus faecis]